MNCTYSAVEILQGCTDWLEKMQVSDQQLTILFRNSDLNKNAH